MKIALFKDMPEEKWYSMDIYADKLIQGLRSLNQQVDLIPFTVRRPFPNLSGRAGSILTYLWRLGVYPLKARRVKAQVYHVLDHSYGHLVRFLDPEKTVVTCHDLAPLVLRKMFGKSISVRIWDRSFKTMLKAARIIAISRTTRRDIINFSNYDPQRIHVIYYGVEDYFKPLRDEEFLKRERRKFANDDQNIILHVGHCHWRKNIKTILWALSFLKEKGIDFVFLQVGGKWSKEQVELIRKLSLGDSVKQINFVKPENLPLIYNLADVFVFPSFYEGFGMPPLEAMACGTPVIVSNIPSLSEIVGKAGIIIEPQDAEGLAKAVEDILENYALKEKLRHKGIERADQFSWKKTAQQTFEVYKEMLF